MTYPTKTCDYCKAIGMAYTFRDCETICPSCFKSLPVDATACRRELYALRQEVASLRRDAERWEAVNIISQASLCRPETRNARHNAMIREYQRAVNAGQDLTSAIDAAIAKEQS